MSSKVSAADYAEQRRRMVAEQIAARGVRSGLVLAAMRQVPREAFVPADQRAFAYEDGPLPIGLGQTISQPYVVAEMLEAMELAGGERVLEIGTGSGYSAALLGEIAGEVYTIERHGMLAEQARGRIEALGYDKVHVIEGDGTRGWPQAAPYDAIVVTAGGPQVPESLRQQLAVGGRLVIPIGAARGIQRLLKLRRDAPDDYSEQNLGAVRFVPLIGEQGWHD